MGRKKQAHYRIVVADGASPRDGRFVETLGYYKPLSDPARLIVDLERIDHWLSEGASPSGTVKSLIAKARTGGDASVALGEVEPEEREAKRAEQLATRRAAEQKAAQEAKAKEEAEAAEAAAAEAAEAEAAEAEVAEEPEAEAAEEPEAEAAEEPEAEEVGEEDEAKSE
jgi:small subunit ribosomal protein S16